MDCQSVSVLQSRLRRDAILCPYIPEDLGPKDAMYAGRDLISCGGEDDQTRKMILDESPHVRGSVKR